MCIKMYNYAISKHGYYKQDGYYKKKNKTCYK